MARRKQVNIEAVKSVLMKDGIQVVTEPVNDNQEGTDEVNHHRCPIRNLQPGEPFTCPVTKKNDAPVIDVEHFQTLIESELVYIKGNLVYVVYEDGTSRMNLDDYHIACLTKYCYENMRTITRNPSETIFGRFFPECFENGVTEGRSNGLDDVINVTKLPREIPCSDGNNNQDGNGRGKGNRNNG